MYLMTNQTKSNIRAITTIGKDFFEDDNGNFPVSVTVVTTIQMEPIVKEMVERIQGVFKNFPGIFTREYAENYLDEQVEVGKKARPIHTLHKLFVSNYVPQRWRHWRHCYN